MPRVSAVQHHIATIGSRQWIGMDQLYAVLGGRVLHRPHLQCVLSPCDRKLWQDIVDPAIAARVAKEDQVESTHVVLGHFGIVFDRQVTSVVSPPFVRKPPQVRFSPRCNLGVPRLTRTADTQKRSSKCVVKRALQAGTFSSESDLVQ